MIGFLMKVEVRFCISCVSRLLSSALPIFTAPTQPGWSVGVSGKKTWPVDSYLCEGSRSTDWLAKGVIKPQRTEGTYLRLLLRVGVTPSRIEDSGPREEHRATRQTAACY